MDRDVKKTYQLLFSCFIKTIHERAIADPPNGILLKFKCNLLQCQLLGLLSRNGSRN